jgi:hypothetical protein
MKRSRTSFVIRLGRAVLGAAVLAAIVAHPGGPTAPAAAAGVTITITVGAQLNAGSGTIHSDDGRIACTVTSGFQTGLCSFTYSGPTQLTLYAAPDLPNSLACVDGDCRPDTIKDQIDLAQDLTYRRFTFLAVQPIYVGRIGPGTGTITSSPIGIDCGQTCSTYFAPGSTVTLTAVAAPGSRFQDWDNESPCSPGIPVCTFAAADYSTIYAIFAVATPPPPSASAPPVPTHPMPSPTVKPSNGAKPTPTPRARHSTDPSGGTTSTDDPPSGTAGTDPQTDAPLLANDPGPTTPGDDAPVWRTLAVIVGLTIAAGLLGLAWSLGRRRPSEMGGR